MTSLTRPDLGIGVKGGIGSVWGWLVALGVALIALGLLAFYNLPTATLVSVYVIGVLMLIAAVAQLAAASIVRSGTLWLLLGALLYGAAGILAIANPSLGAKALTLGLAFSLVFSGATRMGWSFALRPLPGWGWMTASGIVSILAGIVFIAGWPADTVYLLGMVLAVDLTFQGATAMGWGLAVKEMGK